MEIIMNNELNFDPIKQNTKNVAFRVDPVTSQNLTALRNHYSEKAGRRVTTGEIIKQLINKHIQVLTANKINQE